jgi:uncharacterized membrane-anchored protein
MSTQQMLQTTPGNRVTDSGPGYVGGALVFDAALALIAAAWFWTGVSRVTLFWMTFILTRPLARRWAICSTSRWLRQAERAP